MSLRVTSEPDEQTLVSLLKENPINRNIELRYLIQLIEMSTEGRSIFLNGTWGCGKSYFVKQAELLLRGLNPHLKTPAGLTEQECLDIASIEREDCCARRVFLPVYFNSWKHDSFGEPVLSLMADIADMEEITDPNKGGDWNKETFKDILVTIAKCVAKTKLKVDIDGIKDIDFSGDVGELVRELLHLRVGTPDPLQEYRDRNNLEAYVGKLIDEALKVAGGEGGPADAIVVFIDELDRCRPSYAIEVLESVKHLLVRRDVIVVFSVDVVQLAETIRGMYGDGYDAERYLRRFCDVAVRLTEPSAGTFIDRVLEHSRSSDAFGQVARSLATHGELTMRDVVQLYERFDRVCDLTCPVDSDLERIVACMIRPLVCYLQVVRLRDLEQIIHQGVVSEYVLDVVSVPSIWKQLDEIIRSGDIWTPPNMAEETTQVASRRALLKDLLLLLLTNEQVFARTGAAIRISASSSTIDAMRRAVNEVCR